MLRRIIEIDEDLCVGCGLCVNACNEGAIEMIDGKAKLVRDDYCDGLGNCLPKCPTGAISFIEKDTVEFDKEAVLENMNKKSQGHDHHHGHGGGCPGSAVKAMNRNNGGGCPGSAQKSFERSEESTAFVGEKIESELMQWPCQIKLVPTKAPFYENANLLIAADCSAFAYGNFHRDFIKNKIAIIGCPKLDEGDYAEKLTEIIRENNIKSVTIVRMEVPCCGGLENAGIRALKASGKFIPWNVVTISTDGRIID